MREMYVCIIQYSDVIQTFKVVIFKIEWDRRELVGDDLVFGVRLGNRSSELGSGDVEVGLSEGGVREGGGAGSAHSSCEDVMVGSEGSSIDDGVGVGGMAGSAQSSTGELVVVVGALRVFE